MTVLRSPSPLRGPIRDALWRATVGKYGGASFDTLDLFADGTVGIYHDFSQTDRLFQDATGQTAVSVDTNPVALALEQSLWGGKTLAGVLAGQMELVTSGLFSGPVGKDQSQNIGTSAGKAFLVSYSITNIVRTSGTARLALGTTGVGIARTALGDYSEVIYPAGSLPSNIYSFASADVTVTFDNVSVKEISGRHATQTAGTSQRPWYYTPGLLRSDASDDNLLSTFVLGSSGNSLVARVKVPASLAATQVVMGTSGSSTARFFVGFNTSGHMVGGVGSDSTTTVISAVDYRGLTGTMALVENGTTWRLYWEGVEVASGAQSGTPTTSIPIRLFALNSNGTAASFAAVDAYHMLAIRKPLTAADIQNLTGAWA